ncbi:MAG: hypothetical protein H0V84_04845, partial [Actinobacteria bacterium]|nr:hypothetical protein [Actinomycetota bacterium]
MKTLSCLIVALAAGLLAAVGASAPKPSSYVLPGAAVFPEGIAYQKGTDRFYVGSTTDGTIFRGDLNRRTTTVFLPGGTDGRTTAIGMKVDRRGRLIVAGGGTGLVFVYDTASGTLVRRFTSGFAGAQFLNDLVIGKNGDVFVTDSLRPVLYRIPAEAIRSGPQGTLEPWLSFTGTPLVYQAGFNLNGIVATGTDALRRGTAGHREAPPLGRPFERRGRVPKHAPLARVPDDDRDRPGAHARRQLPVRQA